MKENKIFKPLISLIITLILIITMLVPAGVVLQSKFSSFKFLDRQNIQEFYSLEKNTIDLLCVGSSQIMNGFVAGELYGQYGITSYGLGTCSQPVYAAYHWLLEMEKYQSPKVILLEASRIYGENSYNNYVKAFSEMKHTSPVKFKALMGLDLNSEEFLSFYSDVYAYHSRFNELVKDDYAYLLGENKKTFLGAALSERLFEDYELNYEDYAIEETEEEAEEYKDNNNIEYFEKIFNYCKERGIKLVLFKTTKEDWSAGNHAGVKALADKYSLNFLDLNTKEAINEIGFDFVKDFIDPEHYNYYGAVKATNYIGKFIDEKYDLPDHRKDENFIKSFDEKYQDYLHAVNGIKLYNAENLDDILKYIDSDRYTVAIAKRGDVKFSAEQYERLQQIGFTADFLGNLNAAFVKHEGKVIRNTSSDEKVSERSVTSDLIFYTAIASGGQVRAKVKNASIKIEDDDGLSIAVHDNFTERTVLACSFDVNLKMLEKVENP